MCAHCYGNAGRGNLATFMAHGTFRPAIPAVNPSSEESDIGCFLQIRRPGQVDFSKKPAYLIDVNAVTVSEVDHKAGSYST
mgnify:CR=1 FL=1